jgi:glycerophosphoryl diester phosphodiesterase
LSTCENTVVAISKPFKPAKRREKNVRLHNIAHRGASAYEPENTLRAFERAIAMDATMLELDVHLSRDGYLIVIHDAELARTTNGAGRVAELTLNRIKQFDAGQSERVPTLPEVVDLARGRVQLYIELKDSGTPGPLVDVLRRLCFADQVIAASFDPACLQQVKQLSPEIRTSILIGPRSKDEMIRQAMSLDCDYIHPAWEHLSPTPHVLLTSDLLSAIRHQGLGIITWHEERPEELRALLELGVDGICTNTPDVLASIIRESKVRERCPDGSDSPSSKPVRANKE